MKDPSVILQTRHSLKEHTSLKIGGPADLFAQPANRDELLELIRWCDQSGTDFFILGGGANILVSDLGIRGLVISTEKLNRMHRITQLSSNQVEIEAGATVDEACQWCAKLGLGGLDFLAGMPGSMGGAVRMNARCYGSEISDVLTQVCWSDARGVIHNYHYKQQDWGYKQSPFQRADCVILSAQLQLSPDEPAAIYSRIQQWKEDRRRKGHYSFPSAGSMFKNDYSLGKPTGQIIDELGLRGYSKGDAQIADFHGNLFINKGQASASQMRALVLEVQSIVQEKLGIVIEPEVLFVGEWLPD